uniref:HTH psq-type domain-containing protein n=1 Tax=Cuerna arida TaxID=1464854 RepID=A0A1B6FPY1_9HEMI
MGKSCEQRLPPSEALPGIGDHCVVFHNGKGFYYTCKEYSTCFERRQFKCVRAECGVTATMGPELGSPLQDDGSHTHPADWGYRDKCLLLQTIKERFLRDNSSASLILQDVLSSLSFENENENEEDYEASCDFESITIDEQTPLKVFKVEPNLVDPIEGNRELEEELDKLSSVLSPITRTYSRTKRKEETVIKQSSCSEDEREEEEEEVKRPDFVAVPVEDNELYNLLGTPEESLADPDDESQRRKRSRKRKETLCDQDVSPVKQIHCKKLKPQNESKRRLWNKQNMMKAIQAIQENTMSYRKASKIFSVPRSTLYELSTLDMPPEDAVCNKMGRKLVMPDEFEEELVQNILEMQMSSRVKRKDICRLAFELCERNGIKHPFRSNGVAGAAWFNNFKNRHKDLMSLLKS